MRRNTAPKTRNAGTMSESEFLSFIRSALRQRTRFWKPRLASLAKVKRVYKGPNKRQKFEYQCAICKNYFIQTSVEVDHIIPAGSLRALEDLPAFVGRLFCEEGGLRVLCRKCHKVITDKEKMRLKKIRSAGKNSVALQKNKNDKRQPNRKSGNSKTRGKLQRNSSVKQLNDKAV